MYNPFEYINQFSGGGPNIPAKQSDLSQFSRAIGQLWKNTVELNISDPTVFDVDSSTLTVTQNRCSKTYYNITADLYSPDTTYVSGDLVRADGSDGGIDGLVYVAKNPSLYFDNIEYNEGDSVLSDGDDGGVAGTAYISLQDANEDNSLDDTDFWAVTTNTDQGMDNTDFWGVINDTGNLIISKVIGTSIGFNIEIRAIVNMTIIMTSVNPGSATSTQIVNQYGGTKTLYFSSVVSDWIEYRTREDGVLEMVISMQYTD